MKINLIQSTKRINRKLSSNFQLFWSISVEMIVISMEGCVTGNSNSEGHIVFRGFSQNIWIIRSSNIAALLCAEQQSLSLHLSEVCQFVSMSELRQIYQHCSRVLYFFSNIFDYSKLSNSLRKFTILALSKSRTNCKYSEILGKLKVNENLLTNEGL